MIATRWRYWFSLIQVYVLLLQSNIFQRKMGGKMVVVHRGKWEEWEDCEGDVQVIKRRERKKLEIKRSVLIPFTSHDHFNFHRINSFNCYLNTFKSTSASVKNTFFIIFRVTTFRHFFMFFFSHFNLIIWLKRKIKLFYFLKSY